jgi:predicted MFS family arabinose efflux permease
VRPFLETVTQVGPSTLSLVLLLIGAAGLLGSVLIGSMLRTRLQATLLGPPLAMAALALGLIALGASPVAAAVLLTLWGLISTPSSAAWWTWISKTLPDDAEAGGGMMVAVIQLAITLGASLGGFLVDAHGYHTAFGTSAAILIAGALFAAFSARAGSRTRGPG